MAVAYCVTGQIDKWNKVLTVLKAGQHESGALPATNIAQLTTGFPLPNSKEPWLYYNMEHVGASSWYALAEYGVNPFSVMRSPSLGKGCFN